MEHKFTNDVAKKIAAFETLQSLGYTWQGGQLWKPPLGQPPAYIAWDGEGRPPVGAETEYRIMNTRLPEKWFYAKILYISENWVIFTDDNGLEHCERVDGFVFRRYESPEERRNKAVSVLKILWADYCGTAGTKNFDEFAYDCIVAGKIPGLKASE